ncbi:MAG: thioredoxin family protein [bacterium]|nr:thioredoxin family protein [bacterium]
MALVQSSKATSGWEAPNFDLPATDGNNYSLDSFKDAKGLVVVFTCNHCPYAKASWPLVIELARKYREHGVSFVGINPNDEVEYPEDSFEEMKKRISEWGINFPYLRDENQEVARAYDAQCTPDIYLFDQERKLYYRGRDIESAIEKLLAGSPPPQNQPPSMGCSIKWKS